jgi:glutamate-1-semialdehyde aminotransferase
MTAGIKTLEILDRPGSYEHLDKITARLVSGIMAAAKEAGHAITGGHISGESCVRLCPPGDDNLGGQQLHTTARCDAYLAFYSASVAPWATAAPAPSHAFPHHHSPYIPCATFLKPVPNSARAAAGMFGFFFCEGPISNYEQAAEKADTAKFARFHRAMLEEGVYLAPSQFEAGFTGRSMDICRYFVT